jgi:hypothetical protein
VVTSFPSQITEFIADLGRVVRALGCARNRRLIINCNVAAMGLIQKTDYIGQGLKQ